MDKVLRKQQRYKKVINSKSSSSDSSFNNVDEEPNPNIEKSSKDQNKLPFSVSEEFSEIEKISKIHESRSSLINTKLKPQLEEIKKAQMFLSQSELDEFISIEKYIKSVEDSEICINEKDNTLCMDIEYLENLRKQQNVMVRVLEQINLLQ